MDFGNERVFQIYQQKLLLGFQETEGPLFLGILTQLIEALGLPHLGPELLIAPRAGLPGGLFQLLDHGVALLAQNIFFVWHCLIGDTHFFLRFLTLLPVDFGLGLV